MLYVYGACAILGGTVMVCQFLMMMLGLGDTDDVGDLDVDFDADAGGADDVGGHHDASHVDSSWLFSVISFRTIIAALAFFGISGLAADAGGLGAWATLGAALAAGFAAMYLVHSMIQGLRRLRADGTARIENSVGRHATVYLKVPGQNSGAGKVTVNIQGRSMEFEAMTGRDELQTGARVVVIGVVGPNTVEVELAPELETSEV